MTCTKERALKLESIFFGEDKTLAAKVADVHFEVTDVLSGEKRVFPSLRGLCASFSPPMAGMLFGRMAEAQLGSSVPITGCRVEGFRWLLAYFYGLQPTLSGTNVVSVLQCADQFIVTEIATECIALINAMQKEGVDAILPILNEIERMNIGSIPALKGVMDSLFGDALFAAAAIESENFAKSSTAVVSAVLRSDELPITEETVWQRTVEWAKVQFADGRRVDAVETEDVKSESLDTVRVEDGDWRDLMRPFLTLFRFPLMDPKFFSEEVFPCEILTYKQVAHVLLAQNTESVECEFSSVPRCVTSSHCESQVLTSKEFTALKKSAAAKCDADLSNCQLLFRGSEHGFDAVKFHELCDEKGATLTVVLTEFGHVIGGFTTVPWTNPSSYVYKPDTDAWLFVARVNDSKKPQFSGISLPAILTANTGNIQQVRHDVKYGPTFGNGQDLMIVSKCNANNGSFWDCTGTNAFTNACDGVTLSKETITGGKKAFRVVDYEVFAVK